VSPAREDVKSEILRVLKPKATAKSKAIVAGSKKTEPPLVLKRSQINYYL
jgi:hypothetical protein